MKKKTKIKKLFDDPVLLQEFTVKGWVKSIRDQGSIKFIMLNDGSCFQSLQVVANEKVFDSLEQKISVGSSIIVDGSLHESLGKGQIFDFVASSIQIQGYCPSDYPLQKKGHSNEFIRSISHLRSRANTFSAVFRVRAELAYAIHEFFHSRGFAYVHTPLITGSDCEGAGETFIVDTDKGDFFGKEAYLTVSGQLHAETLVAGLGDLYTFGPTFRAENSNTKRHAAEFWMVEPEMVFCELEELIDMAEDFIKFVVNHVYNSCRVELDFFNRFIDKSVLSRIDEILSKDFVRISYTEAVDLLTKSRKKFQYPTEWGMDLQTEHERYLTETCFKCPVFVIDYPKDIKSFYMKVNPDGKTVAAVDMLVPGIGEIIGGSQREDDYEVLKSRMIECGMKIENYQWYLDIRKYGAAPSSGFGLGFERLVMYVTGMDNIRDVIPYPRTANKLEYWFCIIINGSLFQGAVFLF